MSDGAHLHGETWSWLETENVDGLEAAMVRPGAVNIALEWKGEESGMD